MNFPSQIFLTILIMATEQLYWIKVLCGCFRFTWLWLLIAIIKTCTERCALQLFRTPLIRLEDSTRIKAKTRSSTLIKISKNMVWIVKGSQSLLAQFYMGSFKNIFTREERTEWNRKKKREKKTEEGGNSAKTVTQNFSVPIFSTTQCLPLYISRASDSIIVSNKKKKHIWGNMYVWDSYHYQMYTNIIWTF